MALNADTILDDMMQLISNADWDLVRQDKPYDAIMNNSPPDVITIQTFVDGCCRSFQGLTTVSHFTDDLRNVTGPFNINDIITTLRKNDASKWTQLPLHIRPGGHMPANATMSLVLQDLGGCNYDILKYFTFDKSIKVNEARQLAVSHSVTQSLSEEVAQSVTQSLSHSVLE